MSKTTAIFLLLILFGMNAEADPTGKLTKEFISKGDGFYTKHELIDLNEADAKAVLERELSTFKNIRFLGMPLMGDSLGNGFLDGIYATIQLMMKLRELGFKGQFEFAYLDDNFRYNPDNFIDQSGFDIATEILTLRQSILKSVWPQFVVDLNPTIQHIEDPLLGSLSFIPQIREGKYIFENRADLALTVAYEGYTDSLHSAWGALNASSAITFPPPNYSISEVSPVVSFSIGNPTFLSSLFFPYRYPLQVASPSVQVKALEGHKVCAIYASSLHENFIHSIFRYLAILENYHREDKGHESEDIVVPVLGFASATNLKFLRELSESAGYEFIDASGTESALAQNRLNQGSKLKILYLGFRSYDFFSSVMEKTSYPALVASTLAHELLLAAQKPSFLLDADSSLGFVYSNERRELYFAASNAARVLTRGAIEDEDVSRLVKATMGSSPVPPDQSKTAETIKTLIRSWEQNDYSLPAKPESKVAHFAQDRLVQSLLLNFFYSRHRGIVGTPGNSCEKLLTRFDDAVVESVTHSDLG